MFSFSAWRNEVTLVNYFPTDSWRKLVLVFNFNTYKEQFTNLHNLCGKFYSSRNSNCINKY